MLLILLFVLLPPFLALSVILVSVAKGWVLASPFICWAGWTVANIWAERVVAKTWTDPLRTSGPAASNHFWSPALTPPTQVSNSWPVRVRLTTRARRSLTITFGLALTATAILLSSFGDHQFNVNVGWRAAAVVLILTIAVSIRSGQISFPSWVDFGETQLWHRCPRGSHWTYFKSIQRIYVQLPRSKWYGRPQLILMSRHGRAALDRIDQEFINGLTTACPNARVGNDAEIALQWLEMSEAEWLAAAGSDRNGQPGSAVREEEEEEEGELVW